MRRAAVHDAAFSNGLDHTERDAAEGHVVVHTIGFDRADDGQGAVVVGRAEVAIRELRPGRLTLAQDVLQGRGADRLEAGHVESCEGGMGSW